MDELTTEQKLLMQLVQFYHDLQAAKPDERSEKARRYAIVLTETEKLMGFFYLWLVLGEQHLPKDAR